MLREFWNLFKRLLRGDHPRKPHPICAGCRHPIGMEPYVIYGEYYHGPDCYLLVHGAPRLAGDPR